MFGEIRRTMRRKTRKLEDKNQEASYNEALALIIETWYLQEYRKSLDDVCHRRPSRDYYFAPFFTRVVFLTLDAQRIQSEQDPHSFISDPICVCIEDDFICPVFNPQCYERLRSISAERNFRLRTRVQPLAM